MSKNQEEENKKKHQSSEKSEESLKEKTPNQKHKET